ncbi:MAG: DUF6157 family protein [Microvirga sp.]
MLHQSDGQGCRRSVHVSRAPAGLPAGNTPRERYGWGLHHDAHERAAAFDVETVDYRSLSAAHDILLVGGLRSRRAR